jgi:hypothetical protein
MRRREIFVNPLSVMRAVMFPRTVNHVSSDYLIASSTEPAFLKLVTLVYVVLLMAPLKTDCFTILSTTFCLLVTTTHTL